MKIINVCLFMLLCASGVAQQVPQKFNGNFEILDRPGHPAGWDFTWNGKNAGEVKLDSLVKKQGKYSVSIAAATKPMYSIAISYAIKRKLSGKNLILIGNIKTEDVSEGYAGIWMRVDGGDQQLELELMDKQALNGTHDWKEYMISVPYDEGNATEINIGALLTGKGKMWVDSLRLYLDEVEIDQVKTSEYAAANDTLYNSRSGVDTIQNTPENIRKLTTLGQVWGFLKYHHPAIAQGRYNWDAELFKVLPAVLNSTTDAAYTSILEKWLDRLGAVPACKKCALPHKQQVFMAPDYGDLFSNPILSASLIHKLQFIRQNVQNSKNYYVDFEYAKNPKFTNEKLYSASKYPDAGIRLLALYRYWSIIQYYSPNRHLTAQNWNSILPGFIPKMILAENKYSYDQALVQLVSSIRDTHGFISSSVFNSSLGQYRLPFEARYLEDKLVVTGFYTDSLEVQQNIRIGDVVEAINGEAVESMIRQYLPVSSASNFEAAMRDMPGTYLLRAKDQNFKLRLLRNGQTVELMQKGIENQKIKADLFGASAGAKAFRLLNPQTGYIQGNAFKRKDLDSIAAAFMHTKGLIVDMRGYPSEELIHTLGSYLGTSAKAFVKFTYGSIAEPGKFEMTPTINSGKKMSKAYTGKVIVLVNAVTQSNAEFVTMAFQTAPNVRVIGSSTAGADGNISAILLPGGFKTFISGIGVFYPDGTNAQQSGVKIDVVVKPTVEGIRIGRDEVLGKAKAMIED